MRSLREGLALRRRGEHAGKQDPLGVCRAKAGMKTKHQVELFKDVIGKCNDAFIAGKWHRDSSWDDLWLGVCCAGTSSKLAHGGGGLRNGDRVVGSVNSQAGAVRFGLNLQTGLERGLLEYLQTLLQSGVGRQWLGDGGA